MVGKAKEELTKSLNHIATCYLKDGPFICGDEISAADLIGVSELIHLGAVNESELFESNPTIKAWIKRVGDRMQPHYDEANAKLDFVKKMFNDAKP